MPLDFEGLVGALDARAGSEVCVDVDLGVSRAATRVAASGLLRRGRGPGDQTTFFVGELFVLVLDAADFQRARLQTIDGDSHFALSFSFGAASFNIADVGWTGMDYQGY